MFGALSPSEARLPPGQEQQATTTSGNVEETTETNDNHETDSNKEASCKQQRIVSQAELESSLYRVGHPTNSLLSDVAFKVCGLDLADVKFLFIFPPPSPIHPRIKEKVLTFSFYFYFYPIMVLYNFFINYLLNTALLFFFFF